MRYKHERVGGGWPFQHRWPDFHTRTLSQLSFESGTLGVFWIWNVDNVLAQELGDAEQLISSESPPCVTPSLWGRTN